MDSGGRDEICCPKSSSVLAPSVSNYVRAPPPKPSILFSPTPGPPSLCSFRHKNAWRVPGFALSPGRREGECLVSSCDRLLERSSLRADLCSSNYSQDLWDEIGESDHERDKMILQLEQECLDVYRRKVDQARKHKENLHQTLAEGEAEMSNLISTLGERESFVRLEKPKGTLKEQVAAIRPLLDDLGQIREERVKEFSDVQLQIMRICAEIAGNTYQGSSPQVDERDLTLKRLGELKSQLQELQKDKNLRLQKVNAHVKTIHELSSVMSVDFNKMLCEVHPSFIDSANSHFKNISNETLARLAGTIHSLKQEKKQRLQKLQDLGSAFIELWNLMDTPVDVQKKLSM